ncbi:hypothetical protein PIB30_033917 [Stylosanthes scabra]|uniref:Uncharacterized protein n=1 Tax=Stylosanthes scabra TaxID=79078 RepID=A0ABU6WCW3_9FABA|nr:hypothetical protein [Stylosanthes scabra]
MVKEKSCKITCINGGAPPRRRRSSSASSPPSLSSPPVSFTTTPGRDPSSLAPPRHLVASSPVRTRSDLAPPRRRHHCQQLLEPPAHSPIRHPVDDLQLSRQQIDHNRPLHFVLVPPLLSVEPVPPPCIPFRSNQTSYTQCLLPYGATPALPLKRHRLPRLPVWHAYFFCFRGFSLV